MLYSRTDCQVGSADVGASVCSSRDANSYAACSSRYQQHPADLLQQNAAHATGSQQHPSHGASHSSCSRQQQLRPPPVRYSSHTSNLAGLSKAGAGMPPLHPHQNWPARGYPVEETTCTCVLPRTSVLCRLLVAMTVLLVFVQAVSCGMFFCVTLPVSHGRGSFAEYEELMTDLSAPSLAAQHPQLGPVLVQQAALKAVPKLIPRFIHQTYRSGRLPAAAKPLVKTWAEVNGDSWQVRFYSDEAAVTFVRREFPEYYEAYLSLPKDVERADFFRFMVVLRLGGAYADIDAECRQPLDSIIQPADTLLVGWDTEVPTASSAAATGLARQRLIANWFFVAAAGHPVLREVCDHIARNAMSVFSKNPVRDTAERTGQGMWTDLVLRHALRHKAAKHDDPWKVRILPRVAFGVRPVGDDAALRPDTPGVVVLHHFMSSWQSQRHRRLMQAFGPLLSWGRSPSQVQVVAEPVLVNNVSHFPVSIAFNPPFTFMTDLIGLGDIQAAADVSATITAHGTWQPGMAPYRKPAVVDALVGALAKHSSHATNTPMGEPSPSTALGADEAAGARRTADGVAASAAAAAAEQAGRAAAASSASAGSSAGSSGGSGSSHGSRSSSAAPGQLRGGVLVDVGAGQGFFSLAAAARGHRVLAFEASQPSLAAFKASIAYNGFHGAITVVNAAVGASDGMVCLQLSRQPACQAVPTGSRHSNRPEASSNRSRSSSHNGSARWQQHQAQQQQVATAQALLRQRRGYPWLSDAGATVPANHSCCTASGSRLRLSDVLQNVTDVAALRVSAHGHEGFVLQGGMEYLREVHKPDVIYVEFWPAAMRAAGFHRPVSLLQDLYELGYTDIAHAGRVCDERWQNATQTLHLQGSFSPGTRMALQQPTWCKLRPEQFELLATAADTTVPENVMFLLGQTSGSAHAASSKSSSSDGSSSGSVSSSNSNSSSRMTQGVATSISASSAGSSSAAGDRAAVPQQQVTGASDSATATSSERPATQSLTPAGESRPQQSQQPL